MKALREALQAAADPSRAPGMEAYMRDQFCFLGVTAPARRQAQKPFVASFRDAGGDALLDAADALYAEDERELQYVALDLLKRYARKLEPHHLDRLQTLVLTKSWWDTVDTLAAHPVGTVVQRHGLQDAMDRWIEHDDLWVARTALLHQLRYRADADEARLFRYCLRQADHSDFFIRKAIGWALRQHARVRPEAVRAFVGAHADQLSGLSKREALEGIG